ncbi:TolC family protein [Planctomicrobium piriforme]|uniref:Outer membrane efflux protein n=1 Tax=Planctomicrobium piriforme TaxID=1576369 RepID=A0A1I3F260_9PLAN|nr:TolC family protein [Planctomicrobium piriforme]SFI05314.1 Outer membrane efflux protein [Planctomicrobium piriforme]
MTLRLFSPAGSLKKSLCVGALLLLQSAGCSRTFWRDQADRDSYLAINERLNDPRWAVPRIDVTPDPRSRFFDPYDPDKEPLPPDDGAAHVYMNWVDGWQGYKGWHKFGDSMTVENPQWLANFGWSTDNIDPLTGEIVPALPELQNVTLPQAVELAQINKREYQDEIENVYLAALAVTFQRFQFGVRYLGTNGVEPVAGTTATFVPNGPGDNVAAGVAGGVSQLLPAGTQWAVEFANNTLWLFSGGNQTQSMSNLSFSIVQPLLFGAGRKVGLEGLTQSERNLLYEARTLARLRQEIFTDVVGGTPGFLTLLQQTQTVRNTRGNIAQLEEQVERLLGQSSRGKQFSSVDLANWPGGPFDSAKLPPPLQEKLRYDPDTHRLRWSSSTLLSVEEIDLLQNLSNDPGFQVAIRELIANLQTDVATLDVLQLQSTLASTIITLRNQEVTLQNALDAYKIELGLNTDIKLTIDVSMLKQFELIDPRVSELETKGKTFVRRWGATDDTMLDPERVRLLYAEFLGLVDNVQRNGVELVLKDLERVHQALPRRQQELDSEDFHQLENDLERAKFALTRAASELKEIREDVFEVARSLQGLSPENLIEIYEDLNQLRLDLVKVTQNLMVIQLCVRVELIELMPFETAMQDAVAIGLDNRVDLMNQRALVMDARRKVEIAANALLAGLSVVVDGDIRTPVGNKPFDFRGNQSQLRAGLSFTAPLDQIDERNAYRITLINYQRQRRDYMLYEDQVKQQIRNAWRQLFALRQNLETSRRAIRLAALRYDSAVEQSNQPVALGAASSRGSGVSGTNLQGALTNLLSAQNQLIQIWTNYEQNRLFIYRDMGIMVIGEDGMWVDPFYRSLMNGNQNDALEPTLHMDLPGDGAAGAGRSRLGSGDARTGVVDLAGKSGVVTASAEEPDSGNGPAQSVSGQLERAGFSRQSQERAVEQPRRRDDDDHQHHSGRNAGQAGRSRL